MSYKVTSAIAAAMLTQIKSNLDGGRLYIFAGAVPSLPGDGLDMATTHTQVAALSVNNDDLTGLTFEPATGDLIVKTDSEVWEGTVSLDGFDVGPTVTPTFFRFCEAGDDGRAENTGAIRLQGTTGGPASSADMKLGAATVTDNGTNTIGIAIFNARLSSLS